VDVFAFMMNLSTLSVLTPYLMSIVSLIVLLNNSQERHRYPMMGVGVLSILFIFWIIYGCGIEVVRYGGLLILLGITIYYIWIKKKL
jgi:basic amino acid/polyamine antiporter, APA family